MLAPFPQAIFKLLEVLKPFHIAFSTTEPLPYPWCQVTQPSNTKELHLFGVLSIIWHLGQHVA